jgi:hypothetical protein
MKSKVLLAFFALLFLACEKDKPEPTPDPVLPIQQETKLTIWFHALFEGEDLAQSAEYHNISNYRINVSDLRFYVSHVYGVKNNGDTVYFTNIAFLDFFAGENCIVINNAETGDYSSFGFGLGVAPELNSSSNPDFNIALFDANHPLGVFNNMHWSWQQGYRFVVFDGKYDVATNGTEPLISGYSYHTGLDYSYRELNWENTPFEIVQNESSNVHFDMAVDRFFYSDTDTIDVAIDNQSHGTNQSLSERMSNTISEAISYRY